MENIVVGDHFVPVGIRACLMFQVLQAVSYLFLFMDGWITYAEHELAWVVTVHPVILPVSKRPGTLSLPSLTNLDTKFHRKSVVCCCSSANTYISKASPRKADPRADLCFVLLWWHLHSAKHGSRQRWWHFRQTESLVVWLRAPGILMPSTPWCENKSTTSATPSTWDTFYPPSRTTISKIWGPEIVLKQV